MDDQNGLRAHASGFFISIDPAAVIGEGASAEEFRIVRRRLVGEQHQHFAFDVDAFEIVPVKFRGDNAVADEDGLSIELIVRLLLFAHANKIVQPFE